ncbi:glycosyltransferase family 2 protein [Mycobacterium yunnanensis]|uniref:Glycosyltransferase family 2 protein n=1 Tax=Mycobacterium yunnanensis TaxID=368477 RepID=A0A9X3C3X5_9MYCO|nr:glycosyltransferase family 2 protein [Mycobacterium yunnanensis]
MSITPDISVTVVICAYTMNRWDDTRAAVDSVLAQDRAVDEILLVIDHNEELYALACAQYAASPSGGARPRVLTNGHARGLSGARNTGMYAATTEVVAFLDDDARADPGWSEAMVEHYRHPEVDGVGGYASPQWPLDRPGWLPEEFDWVVGCSYVGQPTALAPVRNFIGCNMSMRRRVITSLGGFNAQVGRVGSKPTGCEETELCIRITQHEPTARLLFDPSMRVQHTVVAERTTFGYFARRCYHEGRSKALVSSMIGARDALSSERTYTLQVLPRAIGRGLRSRTADGVTQAAVVVAGLLLTACGYGLGHGRVVLFGAPQ